MATKEVPFQLRITPEEKAVIMQLADAEGRSMSRSVMWAVLKYAEENHGITTSYEDESVLQGR